MREETRARRQREIERAAYAVLEERGYAGTSMLAIARAARASNETLYNWYGDKQGLFRSLVAHNAEEVRGLLEERISGQGDPLETLKLLGPKLLELLTGPGPVALNRAAAADPSNELGAAIAQAGRESIAPLIGEVMKAARQRRQLAFRDISDAVGLYLDLLVGDLQIRCVIGREARPSATICRRRATLACERLAILLAPAEGSGDR
ncbi:MAG: TetR/AcrR family transcriptional regulator [Burkholderiaceae bacterium]|nr:TetR/AcrR family transcriptional regulator [Burkholderiaceae bacterium]